MIPAGSTVNPNGQRLPVNPRRKRVAPEQRKRVATACNNCNVRRIKCSGERPCKQCTSASRECQYPVAVDKVTIPRNELDLLRMRCTALQRCLAEAVPDPAPRQQLLGRFMPAEPSSSSTSGAAAGSSSAGGTGTAGTSPADDIEDEGVVMDEGGTSTTAAATTAAEAAEGGKLLQDLDGTVRYLGETSGATFLDNLKQFMATIFPLAFDGAESDAVNSGDAFLASVGRYQTSDSRPLVVPVVDPLWLPPPREMAARLAELRFFIQEGGGVSGGIMFWGNLTDVPEPPPVAAAGVPPSVIDMQENRGLALYHAAFAYSTLLSLTSEGSKREGQLGEAFFARGRTLLRSPMDITTYTCNDVAVMAMTGMYLIEMNRRDASYMYISMAMHVLIMRGVHRGWSVDERGKRTFWTVYALDRWVSCLMGRPPTILDEAISLDLPQDEPGLPPAIGIRANVELSRITGYIVCNTYRIAPWIDAPQRSACDVDRALQLLSDWLQELPPELHMSYESFSRDRPLCTLHMTYNQLLILAIRPLFFSAVKKAVADRFVSRQWSIEQHSQIGHIRECSDAARRNLRLGRWLHQMSPHSKLTMPDLHNIFSAAVLLLLHQTVFVNLRTGDISDIAWAIEVFEREASFGDCYGNDCARVLRDLSALVQRLRLLMFEGIPRISGAAAAASIQQQQPQPPSLSLPSSSSSSVGPIPVSLSDAAAAVALPEHSSAATAAAAAFGMMPPFGPGSAHPLPPGQQHHVIQIETPAGDALYQELVAWLDSEEP